MNLNLSNHAARRIQQRGIPQGLVEIVLAFHDVDFDVGNECRLLRVSRRAASYLGEEIANAQVIGRLSSFAVIHSERTGKVVSVVIDHSGARGRRYRRQTH